jgi:hypothetical protein
LGNEKATSKISFEYQVPIVPGYIERWLSDIAAGIVDEDIEMAKGSFGCGDHFLDTIVAADVELNGKGAAAQRFYFRLEWGKANKIAAREHKIRPGLRQSARHVLTEPSTGSGNERDTPAKIEQSIAHETVSGESMTFIKLGSRA